MQVVLGYIKFLFWILVGWWLLCGSAPVLAQDEDTLQGVTVWSARTQRAGVWLDTSVLERYAGRSLSGLLAEQSGSFVKDYGVGQIAVLSYRGGTANQTDIRWNGVPIHSPMLGQSDVSLLPVSFFDRIGWQSNGVFALDNVAANQSGITASLIGNTLYNGGAQVQVSLAKNAWNVQATALLLGGNNVFRYPDNTSAGTPIRHTVPNPHTQRGILTHIRWQPNIHHTLDMYGWVQHAFRTIPFSQADQQDDFLRPLFKWTYRKQAWQTTSTSAVLYDRLQYADHAIQLYAPSRSLRMYQSLDVRYSANTWHTAIGAEYTNDHAYTNSYTDSASSRQILQPYGTAQWEPHTRWLMRVKVSPLRDDTKWQTPTLEAYIQYTPFRSVSLHTAYYRKATLPTLNDRYWTPGGNPNLIPERIDNIELGVQYIHTTPNRHWRIRAHSTLYLRNTQHAIQWLPAPDASFWQAQNIGDLHTRGLELWGDVQYTPSQRVSLLASTRYNLLRAVLPDYSTPLYTPSYQSNSNLTLSVGRVAVTYTHLAVARRFTLRDNSAWLPAYQVGNFQLTYTHKAYTLGANIYNSWNTQYAIVQGKPMPMRWAEIALRWHISRPTSQPSQP